MTFSTKFVRGLTLSALATALTLGSANAQNGSNYHVLGNGPEAFGFGAGGTQGPGDGFGNFVPGEDMRGSHLVDFGFGPMFTYRNNRFRVSGCINNTVGAVTLNFPMLFVELDGLNGNAPAIFTNPICPAGALASFNPYGTGPASSASFAIATLGSLGPLVGMPTGQTFLLPENGLIGGAGGTATLVAGANAPVNVTSSGCWIVQFQWVPTTVNYFDNIDGLWFWTANSPDGDQYYLFSVDELTLWQSHSVGLDNVAVAPALIAFFPNVERHFLLANSEPQTIVALYPAGAQDAGAYYEQTENMVGGGGPNFGFDLGRGSSAISFTGLGGQANANPNKPGIVPSMGFVTFDNGGDGNGSKRVVWLDIDYPMLNNFTFPFAPPANPDLDPGIIVGGNLRLPIHATGFMQSSTGLGLTTFGHTTSAPPSGWPDPDGFPPGSLGVTSLAGGSLQLLSAFFPSPPCGVGLPVNMTYGTTGQKDVGGLTYDPSIADLSYSRQMFLFK